MGWPIKVSETQKGMRGLATVRVTKTVVKVAFENNLDKIYEIEVASAPDNVRAGKWMVSLSADGTKMFSFAPVNGAFTCKFKKIACPEGQLPAPKHYTTQWVDKEKGTKGISEFDAFLIMLEILEPAKDAGLILTNFLRYNFAEVDGVVGFMKPRSPHTQRLMDFLECAGAFEKGEMAFSENILPPLEARLQAANRKLMVIVKGGYVNAIQFLDVV